MSSSYVIVFAKEPVPGKVKTRLFPAGARDAYAARLYASFFRDTVALVRKVSRGMHALAYAPEAGDPRMLRAWAKSWECFPQRGAALGQRLRHAFVWAARKKAGALVIGSDAPDLPKRYLQKAVSLVREGEVVLGPCRDGGFYLVAGYDLPLRLFRGIVWSTSSVAQRIRDNAAGLGLRVRMLPLWDDVDDPQSLKRLKRRLVRSSGTGRAMHTRRQLYGERNRHAV
jgi:uncharacterized protein